MDLQFRVLLLTKDAHATVYIDILTSYNGCYISFCQGECHICVSLQMGC